MKSRISIAVLLSVLLGGCMRPASSPVEESDENPGGQDFAVRAGRAEFYFATKNASGRYRYGFVDRHGGVVIKPRFEDASDFQDGLARVRRNDRIEYIGPDGSLKFALPADSRDELGPSDGMLWYHSGDGDR